MATVTNRQQAAGALLPARWRTSGEATPWYLPPLGAENVSVAFALPLIQTSKSVADGQATAITSMTTISRAAQYVDPPLTHRDNHKKGTPCEPQNRTP